MKETNQKPRNGYSARLIEDALVSLMLEENIETITASALIEKSGISRGTFYNVFYDINDVYETIENELFLNIIDRLNKNKIYTMDASFFKEIMLHISTNKDYYTAFLSENKKSGLLERIISFVKKKFLDEWKETGLSLKEEELKEIFCYMTNGSLGVIKKWIDEGMRQSPFELADFISSVNERAIGSLLPITK